MKSTVQFMLYGSIPIMLAAPWIFFPMPAGGGLHSQSVDLGLPPVYGLTVHGGGGVSFRHNPDLRLSLGIPAAWIVACLLLHEAWRWSKAGKGLAEALAHAFIVTVFGVAFVWFIINAYHLIWIVGLSRNDGILFDMTWRFSVVNLTALFILSVAGTMCVSLKDIHRRTGWLGAIPVCAAASILVLSLRAVARVVFFAKLYDPVMLLYYMGWPIER